MKKYNIGYTQGVFDMFHIGHLNLIKQAKQMCNYLIVAVNSDDLVFSYKNKLPIIHENERRIITESIRFVDKVVIADTLDKMSSFYRYHYDVIFIGDDWKGSDRWNQTEIDLKKVGTDVIYLPYTEGISSTQLRAERKEYGV